jgi:RHS repeat-associated protein
MGASVPDLTFEYLPNSTLPAQIGIGDGSTLKFAYDRNGNRVAKRIYNGDTLASAATYVPGPYSPFAEIDNAGDGIAYVYGVCGLSAMFRDNAVYTVATDRLGSVRMVFDAGNVAAAYNYFSFGALSAAVELSANWMSVLYTGMVFDAETGLYNYNARLYDPLIGRFYAPDAGGQFPSPYVYTGNHPNLFTDPTGMITKGGQAVLGATLGLVALAGFGIAFMLPPGADIAVAAGVYALSGLVTGIGTGGLTYDVEHNPDNWNTWDFIGMMVLGGVTGAVGGGIAGGISQIGIVAGEEDAGITAESLAGRGGGVEGGEDSVQIKSFSEDWQDVKSRAGKALDREKVAITYRMFGRVIGYTASGIAYTSLSNVIEGNPWDSQLGFWTLFGVVEGFGLGILSSAGSIAEDTLQISSMVKSGFSTITSSPELIIYSIGLPSAYYTIATAGFSTANNLYNSLIGEPGTSGSSN